MIVRVLSVLVLLGHCAIAAFAQAPAPSSETKVPSFANVPKDGGFQAPRQKADRPAWGGRRVGQGAVAKPGVVSIPPKPATVAPLPSTTPTVPPAAPKPVPEQAQPTEEKPADAGAPQEGESAEKDDKEAKPAPVVAQPPATKPTGKAAAFHDQYKAFFTENEFTPEFIGYWQTTLSAEPERSAEIVQESAAFAAEAVAAGVGQSPMATASVSNGLGWLEQLYFAVDEAGWRDVGAAISAAFSEAPAPFAALLEGGGDPVEARTAMQACMTLALYGDQAALTRWIAFPPRCSGFLDGAQAFLFGGGALADEQFNSLISLFRAVPREVHQVLAVIVPEGMRMEAAEAALSTPGMVLNIYAAPTGYTAPEEFFSELGNQPVAPAFTIEAAAQLVRAAQYVQFAQRPALQQRRDLILRNAGTEPTRYLRRAMSPGAYLSQPDELLPQTAYLWFIDSTTAFQQAGGLLRFNENESMDAILLLADVLSGGQDVAPAYRTGLDGVVGGGPVAIQRVEVLPGVGFVNGINIGGQYWSFGLDATGGVTREVGPVAVDGDFAPF